jgi:dipeptidyl aminopeptidase/acylaminoacyl peptidase
MKWQQNALMCLTAGALVAGVSAVTATAHHGKASASTRPSKQYSIEQFLDTESVVGMSFSYDAKRILYSSNRTGIFNAYVRPVTGGEPTAITKSTTDAIFAVSFFPSDDRALITRDQGGNELSHLYVIEIDGVEKDLTPGQTLTASFMNWASGEKAFYVQTNERDPKFFDVYRYDATSYARTLLYRNDSPEYYPAGVSLDGKWVALIKTNTWNDSDLYLWSAETKEARHLTPHQGVAAYQMADFDPAAKHLYYRTNEGSEFMRLKRYELASGKHEEVEKAQWDILFTNFSLSGKYRVTGYNEDGRETVKVIDTASGKPIRMPDLRGRSVSASLAPLPEDRFVGVTFSSDETMMAYYVNDARSPSNLYVQKLGTRETKRLTDTLSKHLDPTDLVESEVVRFKSFDGLEIPNILYKPHQATATAKAPALVWVHGGPGAQTTRSYRAGFQYLANHGYVVLGVNNRGSSGYGKTFVMADDQKHGKEPLLDCVEAKKYLAGLPYVDPERIGIIGSSYGGYMVLAALTYQPDVFAVGVDIFGVSNWLRTLESMPPWWNRAGAYQEIGDPMKQRDMLIAISPVFHADRIRKPLIVVQGANDSRVLKAESDDIVAAVKKNGVPVEYIVFGDEGHGFRKKKNQIAAYGAILKFLDTHLKREMHASPR